MSRFRPSGVITLLTDFGLRDPFVGVMKGVILDRFPAARIIDLTHGVPPQDVAGGAFWLARSYTWFPEGTVHVAVVDPGVGTARAALALEVGGHTFVGPDNGLLAELVERAAPGEVEVRVLDLERLGIPPPSRTFHGRDVFAPVAAELAAGKRWITELGPAARDIVASPVPAPFEDEDAIHGAVVTADHFGNLVTNLEGAWVDRFKHPVLETTEGTFPVLATYMDVAPGAYLGLVDAFGVLELAQREGDARRGLGLGPSARVILREGGR